MGDYYSDAGRCIDKVLAKKATPKSAVFELKGKQTKLVYKLVIETLKFKPVLEGLIKKSQIERKEKWLGTGRCLCLVYDFLIGSGVKPKKYATCLAKYKSQLTNGFTLLKVKKKAKTALDLLPDDVKVKLPKYARVNKLISTFEKALDRLAALGYSIKRPNNGVKIIRTLNEGEFLELTKSMNEMDIIADPVLPGVLAFHHTVNMAEVSLTKENALVLLPPCILGMSKNDTVLDCCAAPGNKTHQLAERAKKVLACEADPKRFKLLSTRMKLLKANNVEPKLQNFFEIDVNQAPWSSVTKIMLDPSCSGSGMAHRRVLQETDSDDRIEKLALFQEKAIKKAMSFPNATEISYSTCSIHKRENETVVENVLKEETEWVQSNAADRVASFLPGAKSDALSVAVEPIVAATNGFFVALFNKKKR